MAKIAGLHTQSDPGVGGGVDHGAWLNNDFDKRSKKMLDKKYL